MNAVYCLALWSLCLLLGGGFVASSELILAKLRLAAPPAPALPPL